MERPALCEAIASMCLTACFCAFLSLACITLCRMLYICHNEIYYSVFSKWRCVLICVICWLFGFLFEVGNFLGWGDHVYDQKNHSCIWDRTASSSYTYFVGFFLILGSLTLILLSNIKIFLTIRNTKADLYRVQMNDAHDNKNHIWRETVKACRTLFIVTAVFIVCWLPYMIIIVIDIDNTRIPMPVHLFLTMLAHFHSSVNFIIYVRSNKQFRQAFKQTFFCDSKLGSTSSTTAINLPQSSFDQKK